MGYRSAVDACQAKAKSWVQFLVPQKKKERKKTKFTASSPTVFLQMEFHTYLGF